MRDEGHKRLLSRARDVVLARDVETVQRTAAALDAAVEIARAIGGETEPGRILELVAERGRALVSARMLVIERVSDDRLVVVAGAGELPPNYAGREIDGEDSLAGTALRTLTSQRIEDSSNRRRFERFDLAPLGVLAHAALVVPIAFRGRAQGVIVTIDRLEDGPHFTTDDQRLLEGFAASAATAMGTAESAVAERVRQRLAVAEQERGRWARELHDETLQDLAAIRMGLSSALRAAEPSNPMVEPIREAIGQIDQEIAGLRALITDLRPAVLDESGLTAAIETLADRSRRAGLDIEVVVDLAPERDEQSERLHPELEIAIYRIVQEALTNARKHSQARRATVHVREAQSAIQVRVQDDGRGFDPRARTHGFGLIGMGERVSLLDGALTVHSEPGEGTTLIATLPARPRRAPSGFASRDRPDSSDDPRV